MDKEFQSGERLYWPYSIDEVRKEHLARYEFAAKFLKPDWICLDAACGSGYGSNFLSSHVRKVFGLDINDHGLAYAREYYGKKNLDFVKGDLNQYLNFSENYFDSVISFETLEHIVNQDQMLKEFQRILKPGGVLIISTPDTDIISKLAGIKNKFHLKELSQKEFLQIIKKYFRLEAFFGQMKFKSSALRILASGLRKFLFLRRMKRWLAKVFRVSNFFHKKVARILQTDITPISNRARNKDYYVLLAVARKRR